MTQTLETEEEREVFTYAGLHEPTARAIIAHLRKIAARSTADLIEKDVFKYDQVPLVDEDTEEHEHAERLVAMADLAHQFRKTPGVCVPYDFRYGTLMIHVDSREEMVATRRAIGGTWNKKWNGNYFELHTDYKGIIPIQIYTNRETVCERVVTGTETVTETVRDPEALAKVPLVEVTTEQEIVEWICPEGLA